VRIDLSQHGLPKDFFQADAHTKCASQIIGYRFVVWLNNESVAVGFNTSPDCRPSPYQKVRGMARILVFNTQGTLKASRDLPYDADGGTVLVAPGEGRAGPGGTLLFRIEEAGDSKSGILLLDANLKDITRLNRFLEQAPSSTTLLCFRRVSFGVDHAPTTHSTDFHSSRPERKKSFGQSERWIESSVSMVSLICSANKNCVPTSGCQAPSCTRTRDGDAEW
jgi:hypothetical protein